MAFAVGWLVGMGTRWLITQRWTRVHTFIAVSPPGLVLTLLTIRAVFYDGCQAIDPNSWLYILLGCWLP